MNSINAGISPFELIDYYYSLREPFLFILDFGVERPVVIPVSAADSSDVLFDLNGYRNFTGELSHGEVVLEKFPVSYERYREAFDYVTEKQREGDSYLANLTFPTEIRTELSLKEIFHRSRAKYRLWYRDSFVLFSPETFITISGDTVSSFPMKGTRDASRPGAEADLIACAKEEAEHLTIVDLIRNDLSSVAESVTVKNYRFVEEINTPQKRLLQTSSEITGILRREYINSPGKIFSRILPAGSVTGAPKRKTVEIIRNAESYDRGYYCGVCGYYDGTLLDSCVMIRFIEKSGEKLYFKSGGGITVYSSPQKEYQELIDKVNVPVS